MDGTLRYRRRPSAVLLLLLLCGAPLRAHAQQFVCSPIESGDTASRLARRLTGNARAVYTNAFQIRDPARQMFVPKSQYRRPLSTHWEACVAREPVKAPLAYAPVLASASPAMPPAEPVITSAPLTVAPVRSVAGSSNGSPSGVVSIATIGSAVVAILLFYVTTRGWLSPRPAPPVLQRAGEEFVNAFAQPLIDSSARVPPIRARLRFVHHAGRLEISIAPGAGRRYPNLGDHKSNVEYDVTRVMRTLGGHVVVSDRLRASGKWVVIPIRLADQEQTGAK